MAHLLLVDDEHSVSKVLGRRLESLGHSVVGCASNAVDSIDMAREFRPDLVFMDIMMPGKMDGIDAAEIIARDFNIPVIFLTAWADDVYLERAKLTMPYAYILKPYNMNEIKAAIDMTLYRCGYDRMIACAAGQFMSLLEAIDSVFISMTQDLTIQHINRAGYELFGSKNETLHSLWFPQLIEEHQRDTMVELFTQQFNGCGDVTEHTRALIELYGSDGNTVSCEMILVPCATPSGPQLCLIGLPKKHENLHCAICSHCKRIRDDQDEWIQMETYLSSNLGVSFSHSICPTCIGKYYPDLVD